DGAKGDQTQRNVQPERPTPAWALCYPTADQRSCHAREGEYAAHDPHILATFAGRHHVSYSRLGQDDQAATADPLDGTCRNEYPHVRCDPTDYGTDDEHHNGADQHRFAAQLVAHLAVDRHHD